MSAADTLILATTEYPFESVTEASFIEPELEALCSRFSRVLLVPTTASGQCRALEAYPNIEVCTEWATSVLRRSAFARLPYYLRSAAAGTRPQIAYDAWSRAFAAILRRIIKVHGVDPQRTVAYSFWFDFQASGFYLAGFPKIVSRAHSYDISLVPDTPLRTAAGAALSGLYAVSDAGARQLKEKGFDASVARLGVPDRHDPQPQSLNPEAPLTLLTVCRLEPPKRVAQMLEFVRALAVGRTTPVRYIVVGDGSLMSGLQEAVSRLDVPNLTVEIMGNLCNEAVHTLYNTTRIDFSLLLSDREGCPISLCESLMHGVPVIANAVDGIPEIVDDDSGLLLPPEPQAEEFVRGIAPYLDSPVRYATIANGARTRWSATLDSAALRTAFADMLAAL